MYIALNTYLHITLYIYNHYVYDHMLACHRRCLPDTGIQLHFGSSDWSPALLCVKPSPTAAVTAFLSTNLMQ